MLNFQGHEPPWSRREAEQKAAPVCDSEETARPAQGGAEPGLEPGNDTFPSPVSFSLVPCAQV